MPYLLPHDHASGHGKSPVNPHTPPSWSRMSIHDYHSRQSTMVNTCVVPGCGSRSDRDHQLSFHRLPPKNKTLLRQWLHHIGRKNVPLNNNSRICSRHFKNSHKRKLHSDEYPTENLPKLATRVSIPTPSIFYVCIDCVYNTMCILLEVNLQLPLDDLPLHQVYFLSFSGSCSALQPSLQAGIVNESALRPPKLAPGMSSSQRARPRSISVYYTVSMVKGYPQHAHILIRDRMRCAGN